MDNQQQQQTNILPNRSVTEILALGLGLGLIGLGLLWGTKQIIPEVFPPS